MKLKQRTAMLAMALTTLFWGSGFAVQKLVMDQDSVSVLFLIGTRFLIGGVALSLVFFKHLKKITKPEVVASLLLGTLLSTAFLFQTYGVAHTSATNNAFITSLFVIIIPIFSVLFFKDKVSLKIFITAGMAFVGSIVLSVGGSNEGQSIFGDLLTLVCAVFYSLHILFTNQILKKYKKIDPIVIGVGQLLITGIIAFTAALILEDTSAYVSQLSNPRVIGIFLFLGLLNSAFGFTAQLLSQKVLPPYKIGMICSFESIFGAIFGIVLLGEKADFIIAIGGALCFLAVLISEIDFSVFKKKA